MAIGMGLTLEQQQKLVLTPELRQAIHLLQYNRLELRDFVIQEVIENPLLEMIEDPSDEGLENPDVRDRTEWQEEDDRRWESPTAIQSRSDDGLAYIANLPASPQTLEEHLLEQLGFLSLPGPLRKAAGYLIRNLDARGYLVGSLEDLQRDWGAEEGLLQEALALVQSLEPCGVGARNLEECLLLQLKAKGWDDPLLCLLVESHLDDLAAGRMGKICRALGVTPKEVQGALDRLRCLDPRPGLAVAPGELPPAIVPDATIEKVAGEYVVLIHEDELPRIRYSAGYKTMLRNAEGEARQFLDERHNRVQWLLKSIEQRRLTLYKVISALVELQRPFLDHGPSRLAPLTLRQVAELVGVHESTVSRVVNNKFVRTPRGTFELKAFFASGVDKADGGRSSSVSLKERIRQLIAGEDPTAPLSDQTIADILCREGHEISRRTVAKYRDEMQILSTKQRKRH